jgi:hypothetical protein
MNLIALNTCFQKLQRALRVQERIAPSAPARDLQLAFALTQLLIDSGRADAAGAIVVATWQHRSHISFEIICAERVRTPLCRLLAHALSRPFHAAAGSWLLSPHEASALIDLTGNSRA